MPNTNRPCHSLIDADENLVEHIFTPGHPDCGACGWSVCAMDGCNNYVADAGPCEDCRESDGVPVEVAEDDTSAQTVETRTLSDAELLAVLDSMVDTREAA